MTDVDRPGRVDADELDLDSRTLAVVDAAEGVASLPDCVDLLHEPCGVEPEVDESGTHGLHA